MSKQVVAFRAGRRHAVSAVVWVPTGSVGWALVALVASGPVLNAVGQMVVRPRRRLGALRDRGTNRDRASQL